MKSRALGDELEDLFDITHEIELVKEIKDIRDELNILRNLFGQQKRVLEKFCPIIAPHVQTSKSRTSLMSPIKRHVQSIQDMDEDAKRPYKAVCSFHYWIHFFADHQQLEDLLDLKQKQANVFEARTARISGNTITVFTVVTIIFLPASFMAAFFAIPISEYPKIDGNLKLSYTLKYLRKPPLYRSTRQILNSRKSPSP